METQDLHSGNTRSVLRAEKSPDSCVLTRQRLDEPYKSGVAEWGPFIPQRSHFFTKMSEIVEFLVVSTQKP